MQQHAKHAAGTQTSTKPLAAYVDPAAVVFRAGSADAVSSAHQCRLMAEERGVQQLHQSQEKLEHCELVAKYFAHRFPLHACQEKGSVPMVWALHSVEGAWVHCKQLAWEALWPKVVGLVALADARALEGL